MLSFESHREAVGKRRWESVYMRKKLTITNF